jgi:MerR family transcriptional regulator/heat shock protein HspR
MNDGTGMTRPSESADTTGPAENRRARRLSDLDDADAPVYTIGQAADLLGSTVAGLRRLDESAGLAPHRSAGGQRRYSRHQLEHAGRMLELIDEGTSINAAGRIAHLEREVAGLRGQVAGLEDEVAGLRAAAAEPETPGDDE